MAFMIARAFSRPVKQLSGIFSQIAQGNVRVTFPKAGNDELGELVAASKAMAAYLQNATELTRRIAQNDWQVSATPKSEHDVLNQSLDVMIRTLRQMQDDNIRTMAVLEEQNRAIVAQNWHKDGIGQLNAALVEEMPLKLLCDRAVQTVARYVQAGRGVLYSYRAETHTLELQGTFAFTEHDALKKTYQSGEGIIGQVAVEQRAIYLKHLPVEHSLILTGTTYDAPLNTYTVPLLYNAKLCGVMEIASFELFGAREQAFFDEAGQVIAVRLFSTAQREQMREFFQQADNGANL
ncbi:two-component hybrid sensor and regulator [Candidatus Moduliflexus flocculans]|uniref:Two-component hybrid sensor and regulator n=1 Tax=Candidatus Moduliflexus flocculans TaxID=1499966 RepID=A0A081BQD8_9BACT|nr:two-component hybrid sensor and regulator [Candidatus Moduliflexus flocculans]